MDELDPQKIFNKIIFKELDPSVINEEIIRKTVYEQGPGGEAGRLFKNMEVQYEKVTVLRLEFLNILKIDHLWILPNLKILSLAFNKIDKIENLESLTQLKELNLTFNSIEILENFDGLKSLEILNVFGNKIKRIENVECLENLIIFSAGNNLINTKDGLERLRFLKNLRSLNLKGNEIEKNDRHFRQYISGLLPDLTYYEYKHISKKEREEGKDRFRFKLREIMDNEKFEVQERERLKQAKADNIHHMACFVEHLDDHQLFDSLFYFENDEQGEALLQIGEEAEILVSEFREQSYAVTQKIYNIGLEEYGKRKAEEEIFAHCVTVGRKKIQVLGQNTVNGFLENCEDIFKRTQAIADEIREKALKITEENKELKDDESVGECIDNRIAALMNEFHELYDATWKRLMDNEMHLHECINEANSTFEHIIQDIMNDFIENCKTQFVQLREIEGNFIDGLTEAVQSYVTSMASEGREDEIPEALRESLMERDIILDFAADMREMHISKIDGREDMLINRGKKWVADLCEKLIQNEVDRNRLKVMEINYFLDAKQAEFDELIKSLYHEEDLDSPSSLTMMTGVTMETYNEEIIYTTTNLDT
ncbi:unnamed protein product [Chironomus riparius]|uniref:Dynein axonemal assembly factor 1 homolog n=1 Tax=Chironomus riparius TaxID=315576 RepID=A0A9N9RNY4_9DIPT|nr:unnamed protein product [Chironomus riparius]